uniref:Right handed beta helix domain-containing protein n=1 Tax=Anopheles atroparvus TaxID=41427 RepID=A0A182IVT7_ANOAO
MEPRQSGPTWMDCRVTAALTLILAIASALQSTSASVSVCADLCTCTNQKFVTVDCVFDGRAGWPADGGAPDASGQFVLDDRLLLPPRATALNILLTAGGHLVIRRGFFKHDNINHLSIDGSEASGRSASTVEFHEGALCNNLGTFPEILVANVDRLVMHKNISCDAHILNVKHVRDVWLKTEFLSVDGTEVFIEYVHNLQIEPNAFRGSASSKVEIHGTTIESLPKLGTSFRLLSFNSCNISEIVTHAFDANEIEHVEFVNCRLTNLRQQALTERLLSNSLIFRGCHIQRIEKQFVDGCGLKELQLDGNSIEEIAPGAFTYTSIYTVIHGNHITKTGREWLHPKQWTNVTVAGNSFGVFDGFTLGRPGDAQANCYFGNNSIRHPQTASFSFARGCHIEAVHFYRECDCAYDSWMAELFGTAPVASTGVASCKVEESLRYCFNRSVPASNETVSDERVNVRFFLTEFCKKGGSIKCSSYTAGAVGGGTQSGLKPPPFIPSEKIDSLDGAANGGLADLNGGWLYVIIVAVVTAVVLTIAFSLCKWIRWRRKAEETHLPMTDQSVRPPATMLPTVQPRSTSLTRSDKKVMENTLRWLRDTCDPKAWSEINGPMQQLLTKSNGAMSEQEKVTLIGTILDSIGRHNINGDQIVALNDIFLRYLGPPASEQRTGGTRTDNDRPNEDPQGHIYAEVQHNRRLTSHAGLLGDYAAPLDHGGATTVPEGIYAEPILRNEHDQQLLQRGGNRHLISPYAIGDATVQRNSAGAETGNLPDVILPRPRMRVPGGASATVEDDDENEDDYDDEIDGEPERKTMLRPPDADDGVGAGSAPTYAISMKQLTRSAKRENTPLPPLPAPRATTAAEAAAAQQSTDDSDGTDGNRSEHSGSSMQTVRIEDITLADEGTSVQQQYDCNK